MSWTPERETHLPPVPLATTDTPEVVLLHFPSFCRSLAIAESLVLLLKCWFRLSRLVVVSWDPGGFISFWGLAMLLPVLLPLQNHTTLWVCWTGAFIFPCVVQQLPAAVNARIQRDKCLWNTWALETCQHLFMVPIAYILKCSLQGVIAVLRTPFQLALLTPAHTVCQLPHHLQLLIKQEEKELRIWSSLKVQHWGLLGRDHKQNKAIEARKLKSQVTLRVPPGVELYLILPAPPWNWFSTLGLQDSDLFY